MQQPGLVSTTQAVQTCSRRNANKSVLHSLTHSLSLSLHHLLYTRPALPASGHRSHFLFGFQDKQNCLPVILTWDSLSMDILHSERKEIILIMNISISKGYNVYAGQQLTFLVASSQITWADM